MSDDNGNAPTSDPAKANFFKITACRFAGVVLILAGILGAKGKIALPPILAYLALVAGIALFLVIPQILAKKYRTPK